jgi:hypothetical protein
MRICSLPKLVTVVSISSQLGAAQLSHVVSMRGARRYSVQASTGWCRSSGPHAQDGGRSVLTVVHDLGRLGVQDRLEVEHGLGFDEVVVAGVRLQLEVDDVAPERPDAVEVPLSDVLHDEARGAVLEEPVTQATVRQRALDQVVWSLDAPHPRLVRPILEAMERRARLAARFDRDVEAIVVEERIARLDVGRVPRGTSRHGNRNPVQRHATGRIEAGASRHLDLDGEREGSNLRPGRNHLRRAGGGDGADRQQGHREGQKKTSSRVHHGSLRGKNPL